MKQKKGKRKWIFWVAILALAISYVLFCVIYKKVKYDSYKKACEQFMQERNQREDYKGFVVNAVPSERFLRFSGNLSVTQTVLFNTDDGSILNNTVDLVIWPRLFGRYETKVFIDVRGTTGCSFYVDEKMNLIDDTEENRKWYEEYRDVITREFRIAHEVFGIYDIE